MQRADKRWMKQSQRNNEHFDVVRVIRYWISVK